MRIEQARVLKAQGCPKATLFLQECTFLSPFLKPMLFLFLRKGHPEPKRSFVCSHSVCIHPRNCYFSQGHVLWQQLPGGIYNGLDIFPARFSGTEKSSLTACNFLAETVKDVPPTTWTFCGGSFCGDTPTLFSGSQDLVVKRFPTIQPMRRSQCGTKKAHKALWAIKPCDFCSCFVGVFG